MWNGVPTTRIPVLQRARKPVRGVAGAAVGWWKGGGPGRGRSSPAEAAEEEIPAGSRRYVGARGGTRTLTPSRAADFKSATSTVPSPGRAARGSCTRNRPRWQREQGRSGLSAQGLVQEAGFLGAEVEADGGFVDQLHQALVGTQGALVADPFHRVAQGGAAGEEVADFSVVAHGFSTPRPHRHRKRSDER